MALLSVTGFASSKTVQIRIYNITTLIEVIAWTATGVTERADGEGYSVYYYNYSLVAGNEYIVDWKDNSSPVKTASESINILQSDMSTITAKLPTNYIMGSSDVDNHDTDIDAILVDTGTTLDTIVDAILVDTGAIKAQTDQIQFSGGEIVITHAHPTGAVVSDAGNGASSFKTDLSSAVDDFYKDMWLKITSGTYSGQIAKVTVYNGTTKFITLSRNLGGTPVAGVTFKLIDE